MPTISYPAPVGGWNARDDLSNMRPEDAVRLINWRPRPGKCVTRGGTTSNIIGPPGTGFDSPGTIATLRTTFGDVLIVSGGNRLYAWDGVAVSMSVVFSGTTISGATFWDSAHFQDRLIMTLGDGSQAAQVVTYDGSTVSATALNITTGPNEEDIVGVQVHKGRAYYWTSGSQSFWYAAAGAYQGALTEFDLGTALRTGGSLQMMVTLSIDGGAGKDDLAAFIFDSGEVLLYQGDDPGDVAAWELIGSFQIGEPVDAKAHAKVAGTEIVYTRDGVIDLSVALQIGRFGDSAEFSNKITNAVTEAARDYASNEGWQVIHAPGDNCVLLNIPTGSNTYKQYIRETDTGAWWECSDWNGRFAVYNKRLYMVVLSGTSLTIHRCFEGSRDNHGSDTINCSAFPAFTTMRRPAFRKVVTTVKPFTNYGALGAIKITGRADFDESIPTPPDFAQGSTSSRTSPNISVFSNGNFLSYVLQTAERGQQIEWNSTTLTYDEGGPV